MRDSFLVTRCNGLGIRQLGEYKITSESDGKQAREKSHGSHENDFCSAAATLMISSVARWKNSQPVIAFRLPNRERTRSVVACLKLSGSFLAKCQLTFEFLERVLREDSALQQFLPRRIGSSGNDRVRQRRTDSCHLQEFLSAQCVNRIRVCGRSHLSPLILFRRKIYF